MRLFLSFLRAWAACRFRGHGPPAVTLVHTGERMLRVARCSRCHAKLGVDVRRRVGPKPRPYRRRLLAR